MDTSRIKAYATQARRDFLKAVTERANHYGIFGDDNIESMTFKGDVALIGNQALTEKEGKLRERLVERVKKDGFEMTMRKSAYTWFNRFVALRYMELHDFLGHGYRVLSSPDASGNSNGHPEILSHAADIDLPGLKKEQVVDLRLAGDKDNELYRLLLIAQCNALHRSMPFLFEPIDSETELLLPGNLLHSDSPIRKLVTEIPESDWQDVEIIGWIYQFYISEKKDQVIGKVVKSEDIPAATQLFTPNWIVKYMVQNTLGRMWLATYPESALRDKMDYYIEPAEQEPEVQQKLDEITPTELNPEEITFMDPACGSGHILVEAYDVLKEIYLERGYRTREIPRLILEKNLYGLDIDDRAAQLAGFAVLMRARKDDRKVLSRDDLKLNIMAIHSSAHMKAQEVAKAVTEGTDVKADVVVELIKLFENAKTFGSLISVPDHIAREIENISTIIDEKLRGGDLFAPKAARQLSPVVQQAAMLAKKYDCVVTNPPYMGNKYLNSDLKLFLKDNYIEVKSDLFSTFIVRNSELALQNGRLGFMSPYVWMFISAYEQLRNFLIGQKIITSLIQLEYNASGDVRVPLCSFTLQNKYFSNYSGIYIKLTDFPGYNIQAKKTYEAINNPNCKWRYLSTSNDFKKIPGSPISYSLSPKIRDAFIKNPPLRTIMPFKRGMATGDNDRFLRFWHEVTFEKTSCGAAQSENKWQPYNKGGNYRKWYGNREYVIDWEKEGSHIKNFKDKNGRLKSRPQNIEHNYKPAISYSSLTSGKPSMRFYKGFIHDQAGNFLPKKEPDIISLISYLNSSVALNFLSLLSPTLNILTDDLNRLPVPKNWQNFDTHLTKELLDIHEKDWNFFETSWE